MSSRITRRRRTAWWGGGLAAIGTAALAIAFTARRPQTTAAAPATELVMLSTRGMEPSSDVLIARISSDGGEPRVSRVGRIDHLDEAGVRGALAPDGKTLFAVVDRVPSPDRSYAGALVVMPLSPGGASSEARALVDGVAHSSRPVVTTRGTVLVSRGKAGPELGDGRRRVDDLRLTEIDPASGAAKELLAGPGWELHLATMWRDEAIVYWKRPEGSATLLAVGPSGAQRVLVDAMSLVARDFTVDGNSPSALVWTDHQGPGGRYTIERLELATGTRSRLLTADSAHLAPHVWPGGGVAYSRPSGDGDLGLEVLGGTRAVRAPLGRGVDVVRALSSDGRWAALWHYAPVADALAPDVLVIETSGAAQTRLTPPVDTRYEIVGLREAR